jgi:hypothetical protein
MTLRRRFKGHTEKRPVPLTRSLIHNRQAMLPLWQITLEVRQPVQLLARLCIAAPTPAASAVRGDGRVKGRVEPGLLGGVQVDRERAVIVYLVAVQPDRRAWMGISSNGHTMQRVIGYWRV